jgi:hypothetical protein
MTTQPPERPLPPSSLWDKFLLVSIVAFDYDREVKRG